LLTRYWRKGNGEGKNNRVGKRGRGRRRGTVISEGAGVVSRGSFVDVHKVAFVRFPSNWGKNEG